MMEEIADLDVAKLIDDNLEYSELPKRVQDMAFAIRYAYETCELWPHDKRVKQNNSC